MKFPWRFKNITVYGIDNNSGRMTIHTKKFGFICLSLSVERGRYIPCIYFSPNATPWASTFYFGGIKRGRKKRKIAAKLRKRLLGHNFNTGNPTAAAILKKINGATDN